MQRILNVLKDIFDPRDHVVAPNISKTPVLVDFRSKVPYVKDQGAAGSCTAHAGTELMELLYRIQPSQLAKTVDVNTLRFSPLFQYAQERIIEGTFIADAGAYARTIFKVLTFIGCCLESEDAYNAANVFVMPASAELADASKYKVGAFHRILDVDTAKTVLQSGYSFTVGTPLFSQFDSDEASETGMIALPTGSSIGGHAMHVVGCDDSKAVLDQIGAFTIQNSWSAQWGDKGFCYMPYSYFDKIDGEWDFWTAHFGKPWVKK